MTTTTTNDALFAKQQRDAVIEWLFARTSKTPDASAIEAATARCADLFDLSPAQVVENADAAYARIAPTAKGGGEIVEEVLAQLLDAAAG